MEHNFKRANHKSTRARSNAGFSLIEVMVVAVILGIISLGIVSLIIEINKNFKHTQLQQIKNSMTSEIATLLISPASCSETLNSVPIANGSIINNIRRAKVIVVPPPPGGTNYSTTTTVSTAYSVGAVYEDGQILINKIEIANVTDLSSTMKSFQLIITYKYPQSSYALPDGSGRIDMRAQFTAGGAFDSCFSEERGKYDGSYINVVGDETKTGNLVVQGRLDVETNSASPGTTGMVKAERYYELSDQTRKTDIRTITNALEKIKKLRGVEFKWKESQHKDWGFIAQEVKPVAPFLVATDPKTKILSVNYNGLIALSAQAIKELESENDKLRGEIDSLYHELEKGLGEICRDPQSRAKYDFCRAQ